MGVVVAPINHVSVDDRGVAFISGTSIKVQDIVTDTYKWNLTPVQIQDNYPRLSLAEIHSALAYYHDHKAEIDRQSAESDREYSRSRPHSNPLSRKDFEQRLNSEPQ